MQDRIYHAQPQIPGRTPPPFPFDDATPTISSTKENQPAASNGRQQSFSQQPQAQSQYQQV